MLEIHFSTTFAKKTLLSQNELLEKVKPLLPEHGKRYKKTLVVQARPAIAGEQIETHTKSGLETVNQAKTGDMLVKNSTNAGEEYLIPAQKFAERYTPLGESDASGWASYQPTGQIMAIELSDSILQALELSDAFQFIAAWKEPMQALKGDFLALPDAGAEEVYRIAREEFFETYTAI